MGKSTDKRSAHRDRVVERDDTRNTLGDTSVLHAQPCIEPQLLQIDRLASVGELVSSIVHEINNPLNGIINCAEILLSGIPESDENHEFAELILTEGQRVARIVHSLLTFTRQDDPTLTPVTLNDIWERTLTLIEKLIQRSNISLSVDIPDDLPMIPCRSEQIQQVLLNLLINSVHALNKRYPGPNEDKVIMIDAATCDPGARPRLVIRVEDHGTGIAKDRLNRVFERFVTCEDSGGGTGLGLYVSLGIIREHGGDIHIESEANRFTRVCIELPAADD